MTDDRSNDAFAIPGLNIGLSQWPIESTELWVPLIRGTQEWGGRCSSSNKQWLDFFQLRVAENMALAERFMSCRTPLQVWSVYTEFLQKAAADYQKAFAELGKLGSLVGSGLVAQKPKTSSRVEYFGGLNPFSDPL